MASTEPRTRYRAALVVKCQTEAGQQLRIGAGPPEIDLKKALDASERERGHLSFQAVARIS